MDQTAQLHTQTKTLHQSVWKNRNSGQKKMLQREHKEEAVPTRPNFPPIIIISSSSVACCEWVYVCARMRVLVQSACAVSLCSEKDHPGTHWFVILEANLWVGAPLWKAWKLGTSISQDEWEEGAHQRAEPSGWAHTRSFSFRTFFATFTLLLYDCQTIHTCISLLGLDHF